MAKQTVKNTTTKTTVTIKPKSTSNTKTNKTQKRCPTCGKFY